MATVFFKQYCLAAVCLFTSGLLWCSNAAATSPAETVRLHNLILDNQAENITIRFGMRFNDLTALKQELAEGSIVKIVCMATVHKQQTTFDAEVAGATWEASVRQDILTGEYNIALPGQEKPLHFKELSTLLEKTLGYLVMDLGPWGSLKKDNMYRMNLEVRLARKDVPQWLQYLLFFVSWNVYDPVRSQLDFSY